MPLSLYQTSVPVFKQMLQALREILIKADTLRHGKEN